MTVFTAAAGAAATSVIAPVTASALKVRCKSSLSIGWTRRRSCPANRRRRYGPPVEIHRSSGRSGAAHPASHDGSQLSDNPRSSSLGPAFIKRRDAHEVARSAKGGETMDGCRRALAGCMLAAVMLFSGGATAYAQNANPTVTATRTPDGRPRVGVPISFTAVGADADSDPLTYSWNFGDGTTFDRAEPDARPSSPPRTFTVVVTVSRRQGRDRHRVAHASSSRPTARRRSRRPRRRRRRRRGAVHRRSSRRPPPTRTVTRVTYAWDLDGDGTFETTERRTRRSPTPAPGVKRRSLRVTRRVRRRRSRGPVANACPGATLDPTPRYNVLVFSKTAGVPPLGDRRGHHGDQAARPAEQLHGRRDRGRRAVHRRVPRPL